MKALSQVLRRFVTRVIYKTITIRNGVCKMKKRWTVVSLVILLFQYFSPLVAVAESLSNNSDSFAITQLSVNDGAVIKDEVVPIKLKGTATTSSKVTRTINLVGATAVAGTNGQVTSNSGVIGQFSSSGARVSVTLNPEVTGDFEINFQGKILDTETLQQSISVNGEFGSVPSAITLADSPTTDSSENILETGTSASSQTAESDESSQVTETEESATTESETKEIETSQSKAPTKAPAKAAAKRGPQNVADFFASSASGQSNLFTSAIWVDKLGEGAVEIKDPSAHIGEMVYLNFNYNIPEDVREQMQDGDFYEVQLPAEISIKTPIARKTKIISEQKRLDILSRQVDEQIERSQKVTPKHYLLKETVKLTCLLTKSIEESLNLSDLLEVGLEKELLMGKVYYLIRENSYDVCIEAVSGKAFELAAGIYDLELLEVTNEVELTLELERLAQKSGLPLIAIEDSERFLASGDHLSLKVLGEKNA